MLPTTIDEVIKQLDEIIIQSEMDQDRMGYFPALYKRVTVEIKYKIEAGYFLDNQQMEKLDVVFANRYLEAWNKYKDNKSCTESWQLSFMATKKWGPLVLQHLFLGMNAHISLDLGIAAASISNEDKLQDLKPDFFKINEVLSSLVDDVQHELAKIWPLLKPIDWLAGRLDEKIASFAMNIARDAAWQVAQDFVVLNTEEEKKSYLLNRDEIVFNFGKKLYRPGMPFQWFVFLFRLAETGNIRRKIKILNH